MVRKVGGSLAEQVSALLHDVAHTALSHVVDWAGLIPSDHSSDTDPGSAGPGNEEGNEEGEENGERKRERERESYHEVRKLRYVMGTELPSIISHYAGDLDVGQEPMKVFEEEVFPLLEYPAPGLCADRVEYALRDAVVFSKLRMEEVEGLVEALRAWPDAKADGRRLVLELSEPVLEEEGALSGDGEGEGNVVGNGEGTANGQANAGNGAGGAGGADSFSDPDAGHDPPNALAGIARAGASADAGARARKPRIGGLTLAMRFARAYLETDRDVWSNPANIDAYKRTGKIIGGAIRSGALDEDDLWRLSDKEFWEALRNATDDAGREFMAELEGKGLRRDIDVLPAGTKIRTIDPDVVLVPEPPEREEEEVSWEDLVREHRGKVEPEHVLQAEPAKAEVLTETREGGFASGIPQPLSVLSPEWAKERYEYIRIRQEQMSQRSTTLEGGGEIEN